MTTQNNSTVVVTERGNKKRALIAGGLAAALIGGAGSFALLSETHDVHQEIVAGGTLALEINGERGSTYDLPLFDNALPGDSVQREIVIENVGTIDARINLDVLNGLAEDSPFTDVITVSSDDIALDSTITDLPDFASSTPAFVDIEVLTPGESITLTVDLDVELVNSATWATIHEWGGEGSTPEAQVTFVVTGEQTAQFERGNA